MVNKSDTKKAKKSDHSKGKITDNKNDRFAKIRKNNTIHKRNNTANNFGKRITKNVTNAVANVSPNKDADVYINKAACVDINKASCVDINKAACVDINKAACVNINKAVDIAPNSPKKIVAGNNMDDEYFSYADLNDFATEGEKISKQTRNDLGCQDEELYHLLHSADVESPVVTPTKRGKGGKKKKITLDDLFDMQEESQNSAETSQIMYDDFFDHIRTAPDNAQYQRFLSAGATNTTPRFEESLRDASRKNSKKRKFTTFNEASHAKQSIHNDASDIDDNDTDDDDNDDGNDTDNDTDIDTNDDIDANDDIYANDDIDDDAYIDETEDADVYADIDEADDADADADTDADTDDKNEASMNKSFNDMSDKRSMNKALNETNIDETSMNKAYNNNADAIKERIEKMGNRSLLAVSEELLLENRENVEYLEKMLLKKKHWSLLGEARSRDRPLDSLLNLQVQIPYLSSNSTEKGIKKYKSDFLSKQETVPTVKEDEEDTTQETGGKGIACILQNVENETLMKRQDIENCSEGSDIEVGNNVSVEGKRYERRKRNYIKKQRCNLLSIAFERLVRQRIEDLDFDDMERISVAEGSKILRNLETSQDAETDRATTPINFEKPVEGLAEMYAHDFLKQIFLYANSESNYAKSDKSGKTEKSGKSEKSSKSKNSEGTMINNKYLALRETIEKDAKKKEVVELCAKINYKLDMLSNFSLTSTKF